MVRYCNKILQKNVIAFTINQYDSSIRRDYFLDPRDMNIKLSHNSIYFFSAGSGLFFKPISCKFHDNDDMKKCFKLQRDFYNGRTTRLKLCSI